jgi:Asp-tRNA(Asn)/Glu-tRNA(Gln) amidotransferase A subunit family amidase
MADTPLHFKTIVEMASLIASKALSPVEVTESALERINQQDPQYKSYATVMADQALASARAAEQTIALVITWGPSTACLSLSRTCVSPEGSQRWAPPKP